MPEAAIRFGVINTTTYNALGEKVQTVADAATGGIRQTTAWGYDRAGRMGTITGYCDEDHSQIHAATGIDCRPVGALCS